MTAQLELPNLSTFTRFRQLPPELRLKVWEETWPGPRVLEISYTDCLQQADLSNVEEYSESVVLRPMCSVSRWRQYAKSGAYRNFEQEEPLEACPNPAALHVCHESRTHTLRRYVRMQHNDSCSSIFYMNPQLDILWLSEDTSDNMDKLNDLIDCYGSQLDLISQVLIEEAEWDTREYLLEFFGYLNGLNSVHVVIDEKRLFGTGDGQRKITTAMRNAVAAYFRRRDLQRSAGKGWNIVYNRLD